MDVATKRRAWIVFIWSVVFIAGFVAFALKPYTELPLYLLAGERIQAGEPIYRDGERAFAYPALFALDGLARLFRSRLTTSLAP